MNSLMENYYPIFEMYQPLRNQLMGILTDEDLGFQPGGENITLGALCKEIGETEYSYIQSFKTFTQDFSYRHEDSGIAASVEKLSAWFTELDTALKTTVAALSDDDIQNRHINRGPGFNLLPQIQLNVYQEALLIFYGKVSVYLKAMGKDCPQQWQEWIG